jgi:DNA-binding response OmpR family regulator
MRGTVLVVDPAPRMAEAIAAVLGLEGYRVYAAPDTTAAVELSRQEHLEVVLIDPEVCTVSVRRLSEELRSWGLAPAFIVLCGDGCPPVDCSLSGVSAALAKPFTLRQLLIAVANTMHRQRTAATFEEGLFSERLQAIGKLTAQSARATTPLQWAFACPCSSS